MLILSFFTTTGTPATGLTGPTIRIWNAATSTLVITDDPMVEIGDGYYKYDFIGYDSTLDYAIRSNGDPTSVDGLSDADKYVWAGNESFVEDISNAVWDETATDHIGAGTTGALLNNTKADTSSLLISVTQMQSVINTLLKYECNRTRIDETAKTLTVYDDDKVTPLKVFDLKDQTGAPSTDTVCERDPQ